MPPWGLLSELSRQTADPLVLAAGTPPRGRQPFLKACWCDPAGLPNALQRTLRATVADHPADPLGTVGIRDETRARKQGTKTPGDSGHTWAASARSTTAS